MRVGISLLTLVPGVVGGSETYARELVRALDRVGELEYRVFTPAIVDDIEGQRVRAYRASRTTPGRIVGMTKAAVAPGSLRKELRLDELDAMHFPLTVMLPRVDRPPAAVSLLDIQHVFFPEFFSRAELLYRRFAYGWSLRKARTVIAISQHVKETLVERMEIKPERVEVVHLGLDHELFRLGDETREPFLLYPANPWPHKNHARLFQAFERLRRDRPELRLVLTGTGLEKLVLPDGVAVKGRVPREELASLYRRASALVFPSLYEGFGQPPLEAMACGCPVAASNAGAIPEVCGGAAVLFDATDVEAMASAMVEADTRREELREKGLARAALFTWDETARRHEDVYREVGQNRAA
jgi:glycosyltransferase involved in cell wall biosynthesis